MEMAVALFVYIILCTFFVCTDRAVTLKTVMIIVVSFQLLLIARHLISIGLVTNMQMNYATVSVCITVAVAIVLWRLQIFVVHMAKRLWRSHREQVAQKKMPSQMVLF